MAAGTHPLRVRGDRLTARLGLALAVALAALAVPTAATGDPAGRELARWSFQVNVTSTGLDGELDEQVTVDHVNLSLPNGTEHLRIDAEWADPGPEPIHLKVFSDPCLTNVCGSPIAEARADGSVGLAFESPDEDRLHLHVVSDEEQQAHRTVRGTARYHASQPSSATLSEAEPAGTSVRQAPAPERDTFTARWAATASALAAAWALWRWLGGVGLFSRFDKDELLENPVRRRIVDAVEAHPGLHLEEMVRRLDLSRGQADHHLSRLVEGGLLVEHVAAGYRAYFRPGQFDAELREALVHLKTDGARELLEAARSQTQAGVRELARRTGLAPSTVSYHADRLEAVGLLESAIENRRKALSATDLAGRALALLDPER